MNSSIILVAGKSERFKGPLPKQFVELNNKPLFLYATETFINHPNIDETRAYYASASGEATITFTRN